MESITERGCNTIWAAFVWYSLDSYVLCRRKCLTSLLECGVLDVALGRGRGTCFLWARYVGYRSPQTIYSSQTRLNGAQPQCVEHFQGVLFWALPKTYAAKKFALLDLKGTPVVRCHRPEMRRKRSFKLYPYMVWHRFAPGQHKLLHLSVFSE